MRHLQDNKFFSIFFLGLMAILFLNNCDDNNISEYDRISRLNHKIIKDSVLLECFMKDNNILECIDNSKYKDLLDIINKNSVIKIIGYKKSKIEINNFCLSYKIYKNNFKKSYLYYVYVSNPNEMDLIKSYEQFTEGQISCKVINSSWFVCEISKNIN